MTASDGSANTSVSLIVQEALLFFTCAHTQTLLCSTGLKPNAIRNRRPVPPTPAADLNSPSSLSPERLAFHDVLAVFYLYIKDTHFLQRTFLDHFDFNVSSRYLCPNTTPSLISAWSSCSYACLAFAPAAARDLDRR